MNASISPQHLTEQVQAVRGVVQVFPTASALTKLADTLRHPSASRESVEVTESPAGPKIAVRVAVTLDRSAIDTAHEVAAVLLSATPPDTAITIRIAHIA